MIVRYPGLEPIADELVAEWARSTRGRGYRTVWRERDRAVTWMAPRGIAWLYRCLPVWVAWHNTPLERAVQPAPFYLLTIVAARWQVAWLPAGRAPRYQARVGILCWKDRRVVL